MFVYVSNHYFSIKFNALANMETKYLLLYIHPFTQNRACDTRKYCLFELQIELYFFYAFYVTMYVVVVVVTYFYLVI